MKSPIVIFGFNRPDAFEAMAASLRRNPGFDERDIFVFVDGQRYEQEKDKVDAVEALARRLTENVFRSQTNRGLAASVISGVTQVINRHGTAIVIEDDLILMPGFLQYIDAALEKYQSDERIFSVCGYGLKINKPQNYDGDVYLGIRSSSWGWATWKDRWNSVDWNVADWEQLKNSAKMQRAFNKGGSDMYNMLKDFMEGRNKSWAIRFCYSQFRQKKYSIHPFRSLIANEGFGMDATNCQQKYSRFKVDLNENPSPLNLPDNLLADQRILKMNARYHSFSLRLYSWIRRKLNI